MNTLTIFLALTKGEATIEIIVFLIVAGIIGYITAWKYYNIGYARNIKVLEFERHEFNNRIINLNAEINDLNKGLIEKDNTMEHLILEVDALKMLHAEAVNEINDMTLKNKRTEQKLYEKDEALDSIIQRKHLLDYQSFGIALESEKDNLKMISGIGPFIEERLHALDIFTFRQISKFKAQDIETINNAIEYFSGRIERDEWVAQAKELVESADNRTALFKRISNRKSNIYYNRIGTAKKEEADDLTAISGIGGWIMEKLNALDIYTFRQISNFTVEDVKIVTDAIEYFPGRIERDEWILQAQELVKIEGNKAKLLLYMKERKEKIYFDRLGFAHEHHANNLTRIHGIGLWIEERLNILEIFTFKQISNLTPADIDTIADILKIQADRIKRDDWVGQALKLLKP